MPNEVAPSGVELFIQKLNLPEIIAGPAGKAISRLIAGAADIPAAYLEAFTQGIKSKTEAKKVVNQEVAAAAAKLAANDTDIVARAAHNLLAKEYRHQRNKEAVARRAIEDLRSDPDTSQPQTEQNVDEDWLNVFERYAESASSERLQDLWGRVLAGEIRKPKTFSLATLRFISELDATTATMFEKNAKSVINADFIPYPAKSGDSFTEILRLEEAGLLVHSAGMLQKQMSFRIAMQLDYRQHSVLIIADPSSQNEHRIDVPSAILTRVGGEIYKLVRSIDEMETIKGFVAELPKEGVYQILCRPRSGGEAIEMWRAPSPEATGTSKG